MKPFVPEIVESHLLPKDQWTAHWALPIPDDTQTLPKKARRLRRCMGSSLRTAVRWSVNMRRSTSLLPRPR